MSLQQIQVPQIMDSFSKTMNVILAKMIDFTAWLFTQGIYKWTTLPWALISAFSFQMVTSKPQ